MLLDIIDKTDMSSLRGKWKGVKVHIKLLAPTWATIKLKGCAGELFHKCNKTTSTLEWGEAIECYKNSSLHGFPQLEDGL